MRRRARNAGFTLVELAIAAVILGLLVSNVMMVMRSTSSAYSATALATSLEDQVNMTLNRIQIAVMSAKADAVQQAKQAPLSSSTIEYETGLGVENGVTVPGDDETISLNSGQVVWSSVPHTGNPRSAVWSRWVKDLCQGESKNQADDNKNGLIDESGLAFEKTGSKVTVYLTLEKKDENGKPHPLLRKVVVACRN